MPERPPDSILPLNDLPDAGADEAGEESDEIRQGEIGGEGGADGPEGGERPTHIDFPGSHDPVYGVGERWIDAAAAPSTGEEEEGAIDERPRSTESIRPRHWTRNMSRRTSTFGESASSNDDEDDYDDGDYPPDVTLPNDGSAARVPGAAGGEVWIDVPKNANVLHSPPPTIPQLTVVPGRTGHVPEAPPRRKRRGSIGSVESIDFGALHPRSNTSARLWRKFKTRSGSNDDSTAAIKYDPYGSYGSCMEDGMMGRGRVWVRALKCVMAVIFLAAFAFALALLIMDRKALATHNSVGELGPDEVQSDSEFLEDPTMPPDPPEDLGDLCSEDSISTWWGRRKCRRLCSQGDCCFVKQPYALSCSGLHVCQKYQGVCPNLDENTATTGEHDNGDEEVSHSV